MNGVNPKNAYSLSICTLTHECEKGEKDNESLYTYVRRS